MPESPAPFTFFATAARGTEGALRDELRDLRLFHVRADRGGVHFEGPWEDGAYACLHSRIALRILAPLARFAAPDGQALYDAVREVDLSAFLTPRQTLAVSATCRSGQLTHSGFIALKTKDAVVDRIRDRVGSRPSVDRTDPDVPLFVHLVRDQATLYVDLSGESLHRRGYRAAHLEAPLKETLAAAVLRLCGWDRTSPLLDPMCGSGTIPIEAALWAGNVAPGLLRPRFAFERFAGHDAAAAERVAALRRAADGIRRADVPDVAGRDLDPAAVALSRDNARKAGVAPRFEAGDVRDLPRAAPGTVIVTNPPYGARLLADEALYGPMAAALDRCGAATLAILSGTPAIERAMRRPPDRWFALFNGDLPCRLLLWHAR